MRGTGIKKVEYKLQYTVFKGHQINQLMRNEELYVVLVDIVSCSLIGQDDGLVGTG